MGQQVTFKVFRSKPHTYAQNIQDGVALTAGPALLTAPDGRTEPGVIFRYGYLIKFVLHADQAIRVANEIADSVEAAERAAADGTERKKAA